MRKTYKSRFAGITGKLTKKQKIAIACGAGAVLLLVLVLCVKSCSGGGGKERTNTLSLAKVYMDKGEYDRAMNLLDGLLIKNADDKDALDLMDRLIALKEGKGDEKSGDYKVEIDASGITNAVQSLKQELASTNAKNQQQMNELLREQQRQAAQEKQAADEKAAQEKAEAEKRAQEEAARKAAEAELAQKNKQLQKEIAAVNDEISQGKTSLATGAVDKAFDHFEKAQKLLPISDGEPEFSGSKLSEIASALYDAAQKSTNAGDQKRLAQTAVQYAEQAVKKTPKDGAAHYILGMNALDGNDRQKALDELTKAVTYDSNNYLYYYNLGRVQYLMRKYSEAKSSFQTCCQLKDDFAPGRYNLGLTFLKLGSDKDALAAFRKARDVNPRYEKAFLEEARLLVKRGDLTGAIASYTNVLKINNVNDAALKELGSAYYAAGSNEEAEACFRKALSMLTPGQDDPLTYYNLSTVLYDEKKTDEAVSYAKKAYDTKGSIRDAQSQANIVYNYALINDQIGNADSAIPLYSEVLKLNPNHLKTKINLGVMYLNMNPPDTDTALSLFLQAYNQDKTNFEANNDLGNAYLLKKDYSNAVLYYQNALKLDSKNNTVRTNLAQAYASAGQFDNSKTTFTEVIKQNPQDWNSYVELAKVCMSLSDNTSAEKYLVYVQSKQPDFRKDEVDSLLTAINASGMAR